MCTFNTFLEEIEKNILRENLTHVAYATGISRMTLIRCFRENECIPSLPVIGKLLIFLDWKINFKFGSQSFESFSIEEATRQALSIVDISLLKNKSDVVLLRNFMLDKKGLSLYKVFTLLPKLGFKIEISKPAYQFIEEELDYAVYG